MDKKIKTFQMKQRLNKTIPNTRKTTFKIYTVLKTKTLLINR